MLLKLLGEIDEDRVVHAELQNDYFPSLDLPAASHSLAISTNVIIGDPHPVEGKMVWALRRYRYAILDVDRFCRLRRSDERQDMIALLQQAGLSGAEECGIVLRCRREWTVLSVRA